jgi:hypothetical protein
VNFTLPEKFNDTASYSFTLVVFNYSRDSWLRLRITDDPGLTRSKVDEAVRHQAEMHGPLKPRLYLSRYKQTPRFNKQLDRTLIHTQYSYIVVLVLESMANYL